MFSFTAERYDVLDNGIMYEDAQSKYPNKIMIVQNVPVKHKRIYGNIIAIMSVDEYEILSKPKNIATIQSPPQHSKKRVIWAFDGIEPNQKQHVVRKKL